MESQASFRPEIIVQIRPTSPFRPPGCVDDAIKMLQKTGADSVRGVTPSGQNPYKMWRIEDDQMLPLLESEFAEPYNMPRQKLPPTFWQTGHIEAIRYDTLMNQRSMTGNHIAPLIIPNDYAIDLDNLVQWRFAEFMMENRDFEIISPE